MGTPHHAAISTVLPLVDGGPRKLVHGVFSAVMRGKAALPDIPTLPPFVEERWEQAWGSAVARAAARALDVPPPLDLVFASAAPPQAPDGVRFMPRPLRVGRGVAVPGARTRVVAEKTALVRCVHRWRSLSKTKNT